jgi:hypothetical protein
MQHFRIFTESNADIKFLQDYIAEQFGVELPGGIFDPMGSWSGYKSGPHLRQQIQESSDRGHAIIMIVDADADFNQRQQEVLADFERNNTSVALFLFPNSQHAGNLETLLTEIAVDKKLLQCFEAYEQCIIGYESPVIKSKIFAYLDALLPANLKKGNTKDMIQEKNRNYRNKNHWKLDDDYLNPLKDFLAPFFESAVK